MGQSNKSNALNGRFQEVIPDQCNAESKQNFASFLTFRIATITATILMGIDGFELRRNIYLPPILAKMDAIISKIIPKAR